MLCSACLVTFNFFCVLEEYNCQDRFTEYYTLANKSQLNDLQRHAVICSANQMLTRFTMKQDQDKIRYEYQCCYHQYQCYTRNFKNPSTFSGNQDIAQLTQQNLSCRNTGFLRSFSVRAFTDFETLRYVYQCCVSSYIRTSEEFFTEWKSGDDILALTQHVVACKDGFGLTNFNLQFSHDQKKYRYKYRCSSEELQSPSPPPSLSSTISSSSSSFSSSASSSSPFSSQSSSISSQSPHISSSLPSLLSSSSGSSASSSLSSSSSSSASSSSSSSSTSSLHSSSLAS